MIRALQTLVGWARGFCPRLADESVLHLAWSVLSAWRRLDGESAAPAKPAFPDDAGSIHFRSGVSFDVERLDAPALFRFQVAPRVPKPLSARPHRTPAEVLDAIAAKLAPCRPAFDGRAFVRTVRDLLAERFGGVAPRFYREAGLSRYTFSKIMSHPDVHRPDRGTVMQMARAFQLGLDEATAFLALAGYALSPDRPEDRVWAVCFHLGVHHRDDVAALLDRCRGGKGA